MSRVPWLGIKIPGLWLYNNESFGWTRPMTWVLEKKMSFVIMSKLNQSASLVYSHKRGNGIMSRTCSDICLIMWKWKCQSFYSWTICFCILWSHKPYWVLCPPKFHWMSPVLQLAITMPCLWLSNWCFVWTWLLTMVNLWKFEKNTMHSEFWADKL